MSALIDLLSGTLLALGCLVCLTGALGVYRLPDFFSRMHAAGKIDTLAQQLIVLALLLEAGPTQVGLKLLLISAFLFLTSPTSTHAIARAAYLEGLAPWRRPTQASGQAPGGPPEAAP